MSTPLPEFGNIRFTGTLRPSQAAATSIIQPQLDNGEKRLHIVAPPGSVKNTERMSTPWDPNQPFKYLIRQGQNGIDFAAHGQAPLSTEQIVNITYTVLVNTGLFHDKCKKWRKRTPAQSVDWPTFKTFFNEAYNDWRIGQRHTAGSAYRSANAAPPAQNYKSETIKAITNLATATTSDCATTARLTKTNARLTK